MVTLRKKLSEKRKNEFSIIENRVDDGPGLDPLQSLGRGRVVIGYTSQLPSNFPLKVIRNLRPPPLCFSLIAPMVRRDPFGPFLVYAG